MLPAFPGWVSAIWGWMAGVILVDSMNAWHWEWPDIYPVLSLILDGCVCILHQISIKQSIGRHTECCRLWGALVLRYVSQVMFFFYNLSRCNMSLCYSRYQSSFRYCVMLHFWPLCILLIVDMCRFHIVLVMSQPVAHWYLLSVQSKIELHIYVPYI
jgi:hypothetical protein